MARPVVDHAHVHPSVQEEYASFHAPIIKEVTDAVGRDKVVVIGMATNPFVKKARRLLEAQGVAFTYLEYGGYTSMWKPRLAIKMWSGWPTFPQVFVQGKLVGGFKNLEKLVQNNQLQQLLQEGR